MNGTSWYLAVLQFMFPRPKLTGTSGWSRISQTEKPTTEVKGSNYYLEKSLLKTAQKWKKLEQEGNGASLTPPWSFLYFTSEINFFKYIKICIVGHLYLAVWYLFTVFRGVNVQVLLFLSGFLLFMVLFPWVFMESLITFYSAAHDTFGRSCFSRYVRAGSWPRQAVTERCGYISQVTSISWKLNTNILNRPPILASL